MDKIKTTRLMYNKDKEISEDTAGSTGKLTGQGSHFPRTEDPAGAHAQGTGPALDQTAEDITASGISSKDPNQGYAVLGDTSTYSSRTLPTGDALGGVIDSKSTDPTTYRMPEHSYASNPGPQTGPTGTNTGVPSGAAGTAASLAFRNGREPSTSNIPGAYPKDEPSDDSTQAASVATAGAAGVGAGTAATGSSGLASTHGAPTNVPSSLTSNTSPATAPDSGYPTETPQNSRNLGKGLGAVGLGAAAGGAGFAASRAGNTDRTPAVADTPAQPTTVTGTDSYSAPTHSGPSPSHHRKESIPTTAYPAGVASPAPINAPVGGTSVEAEDPEPRDHTGRNIGLATAGAGAGAGAAALGLHEYNKGSSTRENIAPDQAAGFSGVPSDTRQIATDPNQDYGDRTRTVAPQSQADPEYDSRGYGKATDAAGIGAGAGATALYAHENTRDRTFHDDVTRKSASATTQGTDPFTVPSNQGQTAIDTRQGFGEDPTSATAGQTQVDQERDSRGYGKAAAAAGVGAGAGAAAFGVHEYSKGKSDREQVGHSSDTATTQAAPYAAVPSDTRQGFQGHPTASTAGQTQVDPENESSSHGKAAAAAGAGAGAGAAGVYAMRDRGNPRAGDQIGDSPYSTTQTATHKEARKPEIVSHEKTTASAQQDRTIPSTVAGDQSSRGEPATEADKDQSHTGRNAALAGAAGAGAGAYGVHEHSKHQADEEAAKLEAQRQKHLAEQEAARQKQFEKDQKVADKLAAKDEKRHQKDLEKEEKAREKAAAKEEKAATKQDQQHQKDLEQQEQKREKAAFATETERQRQLEKSENDRVDSEEAEKKRREKEVAAAAGVGATGAAGTAAYETHKKHDTPSSTTETSVDHEGRNKLHKDPPGEKKPNILKRIFKRRKNKETGEDEDYETDEEDEHQDTHHPGGAGAATAGGTGAAIGGTAAAAHEARQPGQGESSYEAASGGLQKPSYNPFTKAEPSSTTDTGATSVDRDAAAGSGLTSSTTPGAATTTSYQEDTRPHDHTTNLPYDPSKDPEGASRLSAQADSMGGLTAHHHGGNDTQTGGLGHRISDALKPLPDRDELQAHGQGHGYGGDAARQ